MKEKLGVSSENFCRILLIAGILFFVVFAFFFSDARPSCPASRVEKISSSESTSNSSSDDDDLPLNLGHLAFGVQSSEKAYHQRKNYLEAWWRPSITRGYVYLDKVPTEDLLPWSSIGPPYRVDDDLSKLIEEIKPFSPLMPRMLYRILQLFREEEGQGIRWLITGDDDTVFFVDNLVEVLSKYDHRKYYYIGYPSEFILSNSLFNFNEAFGGGGIILSYPLAKALVRDMDRCLRTYPYLFHDHMIMACLADIGVNLTPHKGLHQTDFRGDLSGFLSSHPKELVLSLHHFDAVDPLFPKMDRYESIRHLMKAGNMDQTRLFQQTICYHRQKNWAFSIAWGYSAHIYENLLRRSALQTPIKTFKTWLKSREPHFMFQTRRPLGDPCEAPHVFFFESIEKISSANEILTIYSRSAPRGLPACAATGNHSAEYVTKIHVISPATKRTEINRCECCDILGVEDSGMAQVKFRECMIDEIIA